MSDAHRVLIASAFQDAGGAGTGGGVFAIDGSRAERIDAIGTTGLAFDGRRLARNLRCGTYDTPGAEIVVYDERGVRRYLRLDEATFVHDVAWDGENLVVTSTWHNAVRWFSPGGDLVHEARLAGPQDAWHLKCVTRRDGIWYATVFEPAGPLASTSPPREGSGKIVELETGKTVVAGLTAPHAPRWLDGLWVVCNAMRGILLAVDEASGRVVRQVACGDRARGVAFDDAFLYVGTSRRGIATASEVQSEIVVVDRATWEVVERIAVPAREIYDVTFVSPALLGGLRRGFDVNPSRAAELRQHRIMTELGVEQPRSLWPTGDPLPWDDFRCSITAAMPPVCTAGTLLDVPVRVTNRSRSFFTSAPPVPVYVSYKWLDAANGTLLTEARAYRSPLPRTVFPGESVDMTARVVLPDAGGTATLRFTLIQEGVSWFDDQDAASALDLTVQVTP